MGRSNPEILRLDESCISNPKLEISNWTVQFEISSFGFEMQDSSNLKISDEFALQSPVRNNPERSLSVPLLPRSGDEAFIGTDILEKSVHHDFHGSA